MENHPKKYLLLEDIRSLLNVGAIFRSVDASGWDGIILTGLTPTPPRKELHKTALGAESWVAWEYYTSTAEALAKLRDEGCTIIALEITASSQDIRTYQKPQGNICLVVGNEVAGVSEETQATADVCVHIPMLGRKASLNVATATGIALYSFL